MRAGKLKLVAVTAPERMKEFPGVPTVAETVPGFESRAWWGVLGPAGLPADVRAALNGAIAKAIGWTEVQEWLSSNSLEASGSSPEVLGKFVADDVERWKGVVEAAGIPKFQ